MRREECRVRNEEGGAFLTFFQGGHSDTHAGACSEIMWHSGSPKKSRDTA